MIKFVKSYRKMSCSVFAAALATTALMSAAARADGVSGTIEYGYWGNAKRTQQSEAVMKAFTEANPQANVHGIVAEYQAYIERLTVQAASGQLPCVTQAQSTFLATYASRGVLQPLDDLVKSGAIDVSGIPAAVLETGKFDGKLYMIPTGTFVRLMVYNDALVKKYGVTEPPAKMTYDEYKGWVTEAQKKLPKGVYAVEADGSLNFTLDSWVTGHGKAISVDGKLGFDQAFFKEYLQFWKDLNDAGAVVPADRLDEQFGAFELRPLAKGTALSANRDIPQVVPTEDALNAAKIPNDLRFHSNPVAEGVKSGNVPGANGLSISASCDNVPTAASFINFFSNDPKAAVAYQSANGVVVSDGQRKTLTDDKQTPAAVRRSLKVLADLVATDNLAASTYPSGYQGIQTPLRRAYEAVMLNGQDPDAAAAEFFRNVERVLR